MNKIENSDTFGERLRELLFDRGISVSTLAHVLHFSESTIRSWRNNTQSIFLSNSIILADYFQCSLDFLFCKIEFDTVTEFKPCPPFYSRLRQVLKEKKISRYRICKDTKIKDSYFTEWSNGADPNILSVIELANYLDCSLDYLVGRSD